MILPALREQTRPFHERLEAALDILTLIRSRQQYEVLLERLYGFYLPLETALVPWKAHVSSDKLQRCLKTNDTATDTTTDTAGNLSINFEKASLIRGDLAVLRRDVRRKPLEELPLCREIPPLDSLARTLGCLYVLEGATLGGQIIARQLLEIHGIGEADGAAFFRGYGAQTGRHWKAFGHLLTEQVEIGNCSAAEVIAAAQNTFLQYEKWVCPALLKSKSNADMPEVVNR